LYQNEEVTIQEVFLKHHGQYAYEKALKLIDLATKKALRVQGLPLSGIKDADSPEGEWE
jgi:hypothetical protein